MKPSPDQPGEYQRFPPHLQDQRQFEDWYEPLKQMEIMPRVAELFSAVETALIEVSEANQTSEGGLPRDRFRLFDKDHLLKSHERARSKLAGDLAKQAGPPLDEAALQSALFQLGDLGRFRIVGCLPSDVRRFHQRLVTGEGGAGRKFLGEHRVTNEKDFTADLLLRQALPLRGHRAIQLTVELEAVEQPTIRVEIQIMTELQHVWDRRNHPMYEWERAELARLGEHPDPELKLRDLALAEVLYLADGQADENWQRFLRLRGGHS